MKNMRRQQQHLPLLAAATVLLLAASAVQANSPPSASAPAPLTGTPKCVLPVRNVICARDKRSGFVAGIGYGAGFKYGYSWACSDGGLNGLGVWPQPQYVDTFNMAAPSSNGFPTLPNGSPDLRYFMPQGAVVTQLIVLEAKNPFGESYGALPALVFVYLADNDSTELRFATCGNALWSSYYLNPAQGNPPPTVVSLQSTFTNPLTERIAPPPANASAAARDGGEARFLSRLAAECSPKGGGFIGNGNGYLGGDPVAGQPFHMKRVKSACFAPVPTFTPVVPQPKTPLVPVNSTFSCATAGDVCRRACAYDKKASSPSASCVATGTVLATGKYGLIHLTGGGSGSGRGSGGYDWAPAAGSAASAAAGGGRGSSSSRSSSSRLSSGGGSSGSAGGAGGGLLGALLGRRGDAGGAGGGDDDGPQAMAPVPFAGEPFAGTKPGQSE